ncbi:MAG: hypothetical protein P1Q69_01405 [Candidatus Thorarchaeota archaeon]|nr:hypothetical protein [Candidatus Thorarchaeota archaeon]
MVNGKRTTFEQAIERVLMILKEKSPITVAALSEVSGVDWRTVERVIEFLLKTQEKFAAHEIEVMKGKSGKIVWTMDRVDKMKLSKEMRSWYIEKRFFENMDDRPSPEEIQALFTSEDRTSVEEVVSRLFKALEIEDDLTVAEIARRVSVNRKTVDRALNLMIEFQEQIAEGTITKKGVLLWRKRPILHELDDTTIKYLLQKWYFPEEVKELTEEQEMALLQLA